VNETPAGRPSRSHGSHPLARAAGPSLRSFAEHERNLASNSKNFPDDREAQSGGTPLFSQHEVRAGRQNASVATFLVLLRRSGPQWDPARPLEEQSDWLAHASFMDGLVDAGFIVLGGPLGDDERVVHAVEAESADAVRATLARDPWNETHLRIDTIDPWTIRLNGRRLAS
jgi:hypothetical protein